MASIPKLNEYVDLERLYRRTEIDIDVWSHTSRDDRRRDWTWLVQHPVVALLAEAGSGKTRELRHQAAISTGPCFLLRVEALCTGPLEGALDAPDHDALATWLETGGPALFLLDAVDEAKLPRSRKALPLRDALGTLRRGIGDRLGEIRLLVTCRSSEWHHETEQEPLQAIAAVMAEARGEGSALSDTTGDQQEHIANQEVLAVTFAPLSLAAIERLGRSHGAGDGFLDALRESGALDHAVTPLDVTHYADLFVAERERGGPGLPRTRRALISASVTRRLAEHGVSPSRSRLRPDEALRGARILSFALTMAQQRDIAIPGGGGSGLEAAAVLASAERPWHVDQVRELLSTALFAHAAQGLVRPYRPEVVAMLAAEHVNELISGGLSTHRVIEDFIVESFDRSVVGRTHGPMLAWLASMRPTILRRLMDVAPELLIEDGDPRALALEDKLDALRRYVATADGLPADFYLARENLPRFADASLEAGVVEQLATAPRGEGFLDLLRLAAAGRYASAAPIALQLASDPFVPSEVKINAMVALVACGSDADLAACAACLIRWGPPTFASSVHRFENGREDDLRHRLARHAYPGAISVTDLIALLRQITGKRYSSNARSLATALGRADKAHLRDLLTGLDELCFPSGNGARVHAAPPHSRRMPDLFRSLVVTVGRTMRERPDLHPVLVPIHGRCLRTIRWERGHGLPTSEATADLFEITPAFRLAILDAYATAPIANPIHRTLDHAVPTVGLDTDAAVAEAPALLERYACLDAPGRTVFAEILGSSIRRMPRNDARTWRRRLRREAIHHRSGRDERTIAEHRWRPFSEAVGTWKRWKADLPWRAERAWSWLRNDGRERVEDLLGLIRDLPRLADGRAVGRIVYLLESPGSDDVLALDAGAARRRRFGPMLVRGAQAHARRHQPSDDRGQYRSDDLLAFAGWGYLFADDPTLSAEMSADDAMRALTVALASPLPWPAWASELAIIRPEIWRAAVLGAITQETASYRSADPRIVPHVLGRVADLASELTAPVAEDLVELASGGWLPGAAAVRSLRAVVDGNDAALASLRLLAKRRTREAAWEGATGRVPEWLAIWASRDPAAITELLHLRSGPLDGSNGRSAMVRSLDRLLSRESPDGDRMAKLDTEQLLALASHLTETFPPTEDDDREGMRARDERRIGAEVRSAVVNLLGERYDAKGRSALERFIDSHVRPVDQRWAESWLAKHSHDAAEREPWSIEDIATYGAINSRRPRTADELQSMVIEGLRDIEIELQGSEFDRRALFREASENDMRAFLGHELDRRHRGHYAITQETVTSREKRTDLRCELREPTGSVTVVEMKLLHGWSWDELMDKMVTQLLERYLISDRVAHGIYLIIDFGRPPKGEPPPGIVDRETLIEALRMMVRSDPRFDGRSVAVEMMRIEVPPKPQRRSRRRSSIAEQGSRSASRPAGVGRMNDGPD